MFVAKSKSNFARKISPVAFCNPRFANRNAHKESHRLKQRLFALGSRWHGVCISIRSMKRISKLRSLSCVIALAAALPGYSQNSTPAQTGKASSDSSHSQSYGSAISSEARGAASGQIKDSTPARINKARNLIGMQIRNQHDEKLGKVKDIVMDLQSGRVAYVVFSTGGFRPRYLALPPSAFTATSGDKYLVLNADKERVKNTAGFSKNNWPNMATPVWGAETFWQSPGENPHENRGVEKNPSTEKNKDEGYALPDSTTK
jgi:sporulation protein YlmC with PRC-barrel domain